MISRAPGGRRRGGVAAAAACAIGCLALSTGAQAATIAVDIEADVVAADGHCSLREAITTANDDVPPFAGAGECAAGSINDVVTVPAGKFVLSRTGPPDNTNVNGDLDVLGGGVTIRGQGAGSTTIDANRIDRVLDVLAGRIATLEGLTLTGGQAPNGTTGANVNGAPGAFAEAGGGGPGEPGGGIRNAGTLTITDSAVSDNFAGDGGEGGVGHGGDGTTASIGTNGGVGLGGIGATGGRGGGIFTSGALTLTRVIVSDNEAGDGGRGGLGIGGQGGGGISGDGGNGGGGLGGDGGNGGFGGGIAAATGATLTIDSSTISGNSTGDGGDNGNGQGGLGGVTSGNGSKGGTGGYAEGGFFAAGLSGFGGGIYAADPIQITRSLVVGNRVGDGGDGGDATGALGGHAISTGENSATGGVGGAGEGGAGGFAAFGGGIYAEGEFVNVTIQGNDIGDGGDGGDGKGGKGGNSTGGPTGGLGGFAIPGGGGSGGAGGGIYAVGDSEIRHATVTANGVGAGGAVGNATAGTGGNPAGATGALGVGFAGFSGGVGGLVGGSSTTLASSVVAGNANDDCSSAPQDGGHNFTFPAASCPGTVVDPQLAPLADNGGATRTQALLPGSPLIDAVPAGPGCPGTDQRGIPRPQGQACDAGAYEVEVPAPPGALPGPPLDTEGPVFLAASLRPATFAVNRRGALETPVASKAPKGTTFRFRLSEAARVVFAIQRRQSGRRVKRRCVKPKRSNRRKPKCTRFVATGRFAATAGAGSNAKKFSGRIGRRALKPGRYRATLIATDAAGNESAPKRLNFRVVRR